MLHTILLIVAATASGFADAQEEWTDIKMWNDIPIDFDTDRLEFKTIGVASGAKNTVRVWFDSGDKDYTSGIEIEQSEGKTRWRLPGCGSDDSTMEGATKEFPISYVGVGTSVEQHFTVWREGTKLNLIINENQILDNYDVLSQITPESCLRHKIYWAYLERMDAIADWKLKVTAFSFDGDDVYQQYRVVKVEKDDEGEEDEGEEDEGEEDDNNYSGGSGPTLPLSIVIVVSAAVFAILVGH